MKRGTGGEYWAKIIKAFAPTDKCFPESDPRHDSIPAMLSRGEYRVAQETLDHYGRELLERINAMPLEDNRDRYGHLLPRPDAVERSHAAKSASQGLIYGAMHDARIEPGRVVQTGTLKGNEYDRGPRAVGKHPALGAPYRLSDGTDISRMTADEIAVHQRRLSPKYPTLAEAAVLRRIRRRHFILRTFWVLAVIGLFAWVLHVS